VATTTPSLTQALAGVEDYGPVGRVEPHGGAAEPPVQVQGVVPGAFQREVGGGDGTGEELLG
jgi:hypothetical protein